MSGAGPRRSLPAAFAALLLFILAPVAALAEAPNHPFAGWSAMVLAGDWRAHDGGDTEAFDNGRRDIAKALVGIGFEPGNVLQYSLRPPRKGDQPGTVVTPKDATLAFFEKSLKATSGCLFYVTSHGGPDGAVFGPDMLLTPHVLKVVADSACAGRPAVLVVSACFSGVFVPALKAPDRLVMTAARRDRASFGCGSSDVHTYFDDCMLQGLASAPNFDGLGPVVQACVAAKEAATRSRPASKPQVSLGADFAKGAGAVPFARPATGTSAPDP